MNQFNLEANSFDKPIAILLNSVQKLITFDLGFYLRAIAFSVCICNRFYSVFV